METDREAEFRLLEPAGARPRAGGAADRRRHRRAHPVAGARPAPTRLGLVAAGGTRPRGHRGGLHALGGGTGEHRRCGGAGAEPVRAGWWRTARTAQPWRSASRAEGARMERTSLAL
jgi:hypothetical protein